MCNATTLNLVDLDKLQALTISVSGMQFPDTFSEITPVIEDTDENIILQDTDENITLQDTNETMLEASALSEENNTEQLLLTEGEGPTESPTIDPNPASYYCSESWRTAEYDEDCGVPCPTGQNSECPDGLYCYGPTPNCKKTHKVGVGTKWCGVDFMDMASKCEEGGTECPNGTDEVRYYIILVTSCTLLLLLLLLGICTRV